MCQYILKIKHRAGDSTTVEIEDDEALDRRILDAKAKPETIGLTIFALHSKYHLVATWIDDPINPRSTG